MINCIENWQIVKIVAIDNFKLKLYLNNGDTTYFNVKPFLDKGIFKELQDINKFKDFRLDELGGIEWSNGACLSEDTLLLKFL